MMLQQGSHLMSRGVKPRTGFMCSSRHRPFLSLLPRPSLPASSASIEVPSSRQIEESRPGMQLLSEPLSRLDVDADLWGVLDLCSDEELELLYEVLHSSSPLSPVVKSLVTEKEPALLELRGRLSVMHKVESRFRFLAADPQTLLQGKRPAYRETLLTIRDRVDVPCSINLSTFDLETEIFLFITQHCLEYVQSASNPDPSQALNAALVSEDADGMGSSQTFKGSGGDNWVERVTAPLRFGVKEILPTLWRLGGAAAVTAAGRQAAQRLGSQLVSSHMSYQAAARAATGLAQGAVAGWSKQACLEAAQKGLLGATARYSALQGAMAFLGPAMWGAFAIDLFLKSIGTDYSRIIRAVFILAQVRLIRTQGFVAQGEKNLGSNDESSLGFKTPTGEGYIPPMMLASISSFEEDDDINLDDTCC